MIRLWVVGRWRKFLHPFPHFPLLQTYLYSPLDRTAEQQAFPAVERAFETNRTIILIARHFARFLDDKDSNRCLRKDLLCVIERRLRAVALYVDPAEHHGYGKVDFGGLGHPLDPMAADIIAKAADIDIIPLPGARVRAKAYIALLAWGVSLVSAALFIWLRYGRRRVDLRNTRVAAPHYISRQIITRVRQACIEQGCWRDDSLLFVQESDLQAEPVADVIQVAALPVERSEWAHRVVLPAVRLTWAVWGTALRARRDPLAIELATRALNLAASSLPVWRLAMNVRCRWLIDFADYSSIHNLRAVIIRKWGGDLVRWPYTETEGPGLGFRYLDYGAFVAGGSYHYRTYAGSWRADCRPVAVGLARNDQVLNDQEDALAAREIRAAIDSRLTAGQRMVVFFANNELPGFVEVALTLLAAVWSLVKGRDDWFLVLKPKKTKEEGGFFDRLYEDPRMIGLSTAGNVLVSDFPDPASGKTTPPAWLIDRMTLGLTLPGTIQAESLTRARPTVAYFPVIQDTPLTRVLFAHGLAFTDEVALRDTVGLFMNGEPTISVPVEWARETWDPFADGLAIDRITSLLFLERASAAVPADPAEALA
jgi:hypothetical protein